MASLTPSDVAYAIALPPTWDDATRRRLRAAAVEAGLAADLSDTDGLVTLLEPEAAVLAALAAEGLAAEGDGGCVADSVGDFLEDEFDQGGVVDRSGDVVQQDVAGPSDGADGEVQWGAGGQQCSGRLIDSAGDVVLVADLGAGSADVSMHEARPWAGGYRLSELLPPTSDDSLGGLALDEGFEGLVAGLLPEGVFQQWREQRPDEYWQLMGQWEGWVKCSFAGAEGVVAGEEMEEGSGGDGIGDGCSAGSAGRADASEVSEGAWAGPAAAAASSGVMVPPDPWAPTSTTSSPAGATSSTATGAGTSTGAGEPEDQASSKAGSGNGWQPSGQLDDCLLGGSTLSSCIAASLSPSQSFLAALQAAKGYYTSAKAVHPSGQATQPSDQATGQCGRYSVPLPAGLYGLMQDSVRDLSREQCRVQPAGREGLRVEGSEAAGGAWHGVSLLVGTSGAHLELSAARVAALFEPVVGGVADMVWQQVSAVLGWLAAGATSAISCMPGAGRCMYVRR